MGQVIDLHVHSTASDGSDAPDVVARLAAAAGCSSLALTDHDTLGGLGAARAAADELGIRLVPGCEISCRWNPGSLHMLVYFVDDDSAGPLRDELARLRNDRIERNRRLLDRLVSLGIRITAEEVADVAGSEVVGRPHFAAVLVGKGYAADPQDAFDRLLGRGRPGYVAKARVDPGDAARIARASGGVAVLAHPLSLGIPPPDLELAIAELAAAGIAGVEALYGRYTPQERADLSDLAGRHSLAVTGGSDYHGTFKPDLHVGSGTGDLEVPDSALAALEDRRP